MLPVDPTLQQTFAENVWLHFFQMGHSSSTSARPTILVRGEGSRVWDQDGKQSLSAPAYWEMGLLNESDWHAQWIAGAAAPGGRVEAGVEGPEASWRSDETHSSLL